MVRILVVDDSAIVRRALTEGFRRVPDLEVVGEASSAQEAQQMLGRLQPDVLTLDVMMPGMSGLEFLEWMMDHQPTPAVVLSAVAPTDSENALCALDLGAVEVISKPGPGRTAAQVIEELVRAVSIAGRSRLRTARVPGAFKGFHPLVPAVQRQLRRHIIAIGASTGGTKAIEAVLQDLTAWSPPVVITQHMPAPFTAAFAARLDRISPLAVREAADGMPLQPGVALVAPGGFHLTVEKTKGQYVARVQTGAKVHYQCPSVDVLFESVAACAGSDAVGAILTGMGADGAAGLRSMRSTGAHTLAEDESTCVVFGMPRVAIEMHAASEVVPLPQMAKAILAAATVLSNGRASSS